MNQLREQGVYALPDGREFVAHAVFRGGYVLFTPGDWEFSGIHFYETNHAGQIRSKGQPTSWRVRRPDRHRKDGPLPLKERGGAETVRRLGGR